MSCTSSILPHLAFRATARTADLPIPSGAVDGRDHFVSRAESFSTYPSAPAAKPPSNRLGLGMHGHEDDSRLGPRRRISTAAATPSRLRGLHREDRAQTTATIAQGQNAIEYTLKNLSHPAVPVSGSLQGSDAATLH